MPDKQLIELRRRLQHAVELELSTIPPYLTAAMSIPKEANRDAFTIIRSVFIEEMLHLLLAGNVLTAIGGQVKLGERNVPKYPLRLEFDGKAFRDREFDVNLERMTPGSIEIFKKIELPEGFGPGTPKAPPGREDFEVSGYTIGEFYQQIKDDLAQLNEEIGHDKLFSGDPKHQLNVAFYWAGGGIPIEVRDLDSACKAIDVIVDQGEGSSGSIWDGDHMNFGQMPEVAHYFRFNEIACKRRYALTDKPHDPPSGDPIDVDYDAVLPTLTNPTTESYAKGTELWELNHRFNRAYSRMLSELQEGFAGNQLVIYTAIRNGMAGLPEIGGKMMRTKIPGDPKERTGSPSFEWVEPR